MARADKQGGPSTDPTQSQRIKPQSRIVAFSPPPPSLSTAPSPCTGRGGVLLRAACCVLVLRARAARWSLPCFPPPAARARGRMRPSRLPDRCIPHLLRLLLVLPFPLSPRAARQATGAAR